MNTMWTQAEGIALLQQLEPKLAAVGAHCALGGSVLYRGTSDKDLDIIILPHTKKLAEGWDMTAVRQVLSDHFVNDLHDCGGASQIRDDKMVSWIQTQDNKRIDFFFLS